MIISKQKKAVTLFATAFPIIHDNLVSLLPQNSFFT